jgi:GAF domain-containing protein
VSSTWKYAASNHLPVLYRLGKLVTASLDLDATLGAIVDAAHELTGAESTAILLQDEDGALVIRIGRGVIASSVGERVSTRSSLAGRALRTGRPVLVDDMVSEVDRARPDLDQRSGTRSYLASPLIWRDEQLGVVTVGGGRPSMFGEDLVQLVTELQNKQRWQSLTPAPTPTSGGFGKREKLSCGSCLNVPLSSRGFSDR